MKRIIITTASMLICLALAWIAGFDFDSRGFYAFMVAFITLWCGFFAYYIYGISNDL